MSKKDCECFFIEPYPAIINNKCVGYKAVEDEFKAKKEKKQREEEISRKKICGLIIHFIEEMQLKKRAELIKKGVSKEQLGKFDADCKSIRDKNCVKLDAMQRSEDIKTELMSIIKHHRLAAEYMCKNQISMDTLIGVGFGYLDFMFLTHISAADWINHMFLKKEQAAALGLNTRSANILIKHTDWTPYLIQQVFGIECVLNNNNKHINWKLI